MELIRHQAPENGHPDAPDAQSDALESFRMRTSALRQQLNATIQHTQRTDSATFHDHVRQTTAE